MESKPFALIGINTNGYDAKKLKEVMDKENLNWRSFADSTSDGEHFGPIATAWNLRGTPTIFIIDHEGVIRNRWLGSPGTGAIDRALQDLIKKAEKGAEQESK